MMAMALVDCGYPSGIQAVKRLHCIVFQVSLDDDVIGYFKDKFIGVLDSRIVQQCLYTVCAVIILLFSARVACFFWDVYLRSS